MVTTEAALHQVEFDEEDATLREELAASIIKLAIFGVFERTHDPRFTAIINDLRDILGDINVLAEDLVAVEFEGAPRDGESHLAITVHQDLIKHLIGKRPEQRPGQSAQEAVKRQRINVFLNLGSVLGKLWHGDRIRLNVIGLRPNPSADPPLRLQDITVSS